MSKGIFNDAPLVLIEWVDSFGCASNWGEVKDLHDREPPICRSVGWLLVDGDNIKVVVPHMHESDAEIGATESGTGDMSIPAVAVRKIYRLRKA